MKPDRKYVVQKAIPLSSGKSIPVNTIITRTHGLYYLDGGLLTPDYQNDFDSLIEDETMKGWNYLVPIQEKEYIL